MIYFTVYIKIDGIAGGSTPPAGLDPGQSQFRTQ